VNITATVDDMTNMTNVTHSQQQVNNVIAC